MTALNLCLFNLDWYAVLGDSLKMEARWLWRTRSSMLGGEVRELYPDKVGNSFTSGTALQPSDNREQEAGALDLDVDLCQAGLITVVGMRNGDMYSAWLKREAPTSIEKA